MENFMLQKLLLLLAITLVSFSAFSVNINTASALEIEEGLKGVGKNKAAAIISYRNEKGQFKSLNDLSDVKGIGAIIVYRNIDRIEL